MSFTKEQVAMLSAKLDAGHVKQREQAGRKLSYVEAWHAIAEANRIFGFDGWNRETIELKQVHEPYQNDRSNWVVGYSAKVRITVYIDGYDKAAVMREGCGFGSGIDRDLGRAHESALKEAESDAMKRGLMTFGNPFGLALYDKTQENVEHAAPAPQRGASLKGAPNTAGTPPQAPGKVADITPGAANSRNWKAIGDHIIGEAAKRKDIQIFNIYLRNVAVEMKAMETEAPAEYARVKGEIAKQKELLGALVP